MERLLGLKAEGTRRDYERERRAFENWRAAPIPQGAGGEGPSKKLFRLYFVCNAKNERFQNSGWCISSQLRWHLLANHAIYVSAESAKTSMLCFPFAVAAFMCLQLSRVLCFRGHQQ